MVFVSPGTQPGHPLNHHYPASAVLVAIDALWHQSGATFELVFRRACSTRANLNAGSDLLQVRALWALGYFGVCFGSKELRKCGILYPICHLRFLPSR